MMQLAKLNSNFKSAKNDKTVENNIVKRKPGRPPKKRPIIT
jgi:hypothetical protein